MFSHFPPKTLKQSAAELTTNGRSHIGSAESV
jgi:hypothetical protein